MTKYIGSQPATSFEAVKKDRFTGLTGTGVTLSHSVSSVQDIVVWVNNVKQDYNNYTVSNTALTLGGSLVSADVVQVLYVGRTFQTVNPSAASVGNNEVASTIITGQTALAATPDDTDELLISDAGTLKRIDYSYLKASNTPAFEAQRPQSAQVVSNNTDTKVQFSTENFDTDNCYDNSTNYRFTPNVAGKYFVYARIMTRAETNGQLVVGVVSLKKNGTTIGSTRFDNGSNKVNNKTPVINQIVDLNGSSDYIECFGEVSVGSGNAQFYNDSAERTIFGAYKIIGA